eukprot:scaffold2581_cov55-Phaeocystis_antarctica.AAC.1
MQCVCSAGSMRVIGPAACRPFRRVGRPRRSRCLSKTRGPADTADWWRRTTLAEPPPAQSPACSSTPLVARPSTSTSTASSAVGSADAASALAADAARERRFRRTAEPLSRRGRTPGGVGPSAAASAGGLSIATLSRSAAEANALKARAFAENAGSKSVARPSAVAA